MPLPPPNYIVPSAYVLVALGIGPAPEFISCSASDAGAQGVGMFAAGLYVLAGTIILVPPQSLPQYATYLPWVPPDGYFVAMADGYLPNTQPSWGQGTDSLHFAKGPTGAPSG